MKDGHLYALASNNDLFCIETAGGKTTWKMALNPDSGEGGDAARGGGDRPGNRGGEGRPPRGDREPGAGRPGGERGEDGGGRRARGGGGGRGGYGAIVDAGKVLLVLTPSGELVAIEPGGNAYREVARIKVAESGAYAYPVVSGNRIIIKDQNDLALYTGSVRLIRRLEPVSGRSWGLPELVAIAVIAWLSRRSLRPVPSTPQVRVDAAANGDRLEPIWRFFGADEPNYANMEFGRELLGELGALKPREVFFRAHNLMTSGDGSRRSSGGRPGGTARTAAAARSTTGRSSTGSSTPTWRTAFAPCGVGLHARSALDQPAALPPFVDPAAGLPPASPPAGPTLPRTTRSGRN